MLMAWEQTPTERFYRDEISPERLQRIALFSDDAEALEAALPQIQAVVGFNSSSSQDLLPSMGSLRLAQTLGHGAGGILRSAGLIRERKIVIARANTDDSTIAEFLLGNMIALSRRIMQMHIRLARHGDCTDETRARHGEGSIGGELFGSALGLIGFGGIVRELTAQATATRMESAPLMRRPDRQDTTAGPRRGQSRDRFVLGTLRLCRARPPFGGRCSLGERSRSTLRHALSGLSLHHQPSGAGR